MPAEQARGSRERTFTRVVTGVVTGVDGSSVKEKSGGGCSFGLDEGLADESKEREGVCVSGKDSGSVGTRVNEGV